MSEEEDLTAAVLERAQEVDGKKKLSCAEAFGLAKKFDAKIIDVGRICNEQDVRIRKCQLGCFE